MNKIEWSEGAVRDLRKIDSQIARKILKKLSWLSNNLEAIVPEPLSGDFKRAYKLRVGDWRVIYSIEGNVVIIQSVGHRREIYQQ